MQSEILSLVICLWLTSGSCPIRGEDGLALTQKILLPKFKVNVMVDCHALEQEGSSFRHWILPNLVVIGANNSGNNYRNVVVNPENFSLAIWRIAGDQVGDYLCYAEDTSGRPLYSRTSLLLYVASFWEAYRRNFILSLSASGTFFVVASIFCVVSSLRWRKTAPDLDNDPLPVKPNGPGPERPRGNLEFSVYPTVTISGVAALDEVMGSGVMRVTVDSPLQGEKKSVAELEDDTTM